MKHIILDVYTIFLFLFVLYIILAHGMGLVSFRHLINKLKFWKYIKIPKRPKKLYSAKDIETLDSYLSSWLPSALRDLAIRSKVFPPGQGSIEKWRSTLRQIARGIETGHKLSELDYDFRDIRLAEGMQKDFSEAMDLLKKHFFDLWI